MARLLPRALSLLALLAVFLLPSRAAAGPLADAVSAVTSAAPSGEGVDAASKAIRTGHFHLVFASGRLYPLVGQGRLVGAFFVGSGKMVYTSNDPLEAPVYRTNVSRVSRYKIDSDGSVTDEVTRAAVWFAVTPAGLGLPSAPWAAAPESAAAAWKEHVERFANDRHVRAEQILPQALLEASGGVLLADVEGSKDDLAYLHDPLRTGEETLATLRKIDSLYRASAKFYKENRFPNELSAQPIGRDRLTGFSGRALLTDVDLTLTNPGGLRAELQVNETYRVEAQLRTLDLRLWSHRIGSAGALGSIDRNPWTIRSVKGADGTPLEFSHLEGDLVVHLAKPAAAGETVALSFDVAGDVLFPPSNDNYWELPTGAWFPQPTRLADQAFAYHAVVKVKKPFTAFSDGATLRRWEEGELACAEFREEKPINIPVVIAGKYTTKSEERGGVTVRVSSYAMAKTIAEKKITNILFGLLDFYGHYLGPFPFKEINVVEINSYGFGQAPAGVIRITKEAFNPYEDDVAHLFSQGINQRLSHELAHTWWGHVAKLGRTENVWMSESLAEYFSWWALENVWEKGKMEEGLREWRKRDSLVNPKGTVFLASALSGTDAQREYVTLAYSRGPLVLHAFRREVGDNAFFTICKSYLKNFAWKPAETAGFLLAAKVVTKKDWGPWFEARLMGTTPAEQK